MAAHRRPRETQRDKAHRLFLERARQLPGVVCVEPYGGETIGEQSFHIYLRDGDLDAEYRVYELKADIYQIYPEARLEVWVFEESDLPQATPESA